MPTALVVGAGIGGLASGLALRRAGWDVRVFERAAEARPVGFALGLAPTAMAALRRLGVADAVAATAFTPTVAEVRRPDGRVLRRFAGRIDRAARDFPSLILRPVLHGVLSRALGALGGAVETHCGVDGFVIVGDRVELRLCDGTTVTGDVLVGADGVASTIRAVLHPFDPPSQPSGYLAVRGLSPAVDRLGDAQAFWYLGDGVESGIVQASPRAIYWFQSLLTRDVPSTLGVDEVVARVSARFDPQYRAIVEATPPDARRLDELFVRPPLDRWGSGRVTVVGDAAHPVLPHTGQGAALALEDAVALGEAFASGADPVAALRRYEAARAGPTRRLVKAGPRIARMTTTRSRLVTFMRDAAIRAVPTALLAMAFSQPAREQRSET